MIKEKKEITRKKVVALVLTSLIVESSLFGVIGFNKYNEFQNEKEVQMEQNKALKATIDKAENQLEKIELKFDEVNNLLNESETELKSVDQELQKKNLELKIAQEQLKVEKTKNQTLEQQIAAYKAKK